MAGIGDLIAAVQNWVVAENSFSKQISGSFTNISNQLAATAASSTVTALSCSVTAIQASYVRSIASLSSDFTLASTTGITNSSRAIILSQASTSQFGSVKVDGTTITAASGVISAVAASSIPILSKFTNSISSDVALNNIANFFTGPTVSQGSSGTWFASGTITLTDVGVAAMEAKLWDGTTVIDSARTTLFGAGHTTISLSGYITSPASNIKISARDASNVTGLIIANVTGTGVDSTITALRIA